MKLPSSPLPSPPPLSSFPNQQRIPRHAAVLHHVYLRSLICVAIACCYATYQQICTLTHARNARTQPILTLIFFYYILIGVPAIWCAASNIWTCNTQAPRTTPSEAEAEAEAEAEQPDRGGSRSDGILDGIRRASGTPPPPIHFVFR